MGRVGDIQDVVCVVRHKLLYFDCHSGLDPESSLFAPLDSCFRRNDRFNTTLCVKKCWTHYSSMSPRGGLG